MSSLTSQKIDFQSIADDFRNLNQDVGAWPAAPRIAVLVGVLCFILLGGWWFLWKDQLDELDQRQQEELKLKDEFIAKK